MIIEKTAIAPPNIAILKYWGKKNDLLKIALNDSISITLDENTLCSKAKLSIFEDRQKDEIWLNSKKVNDAKIEEWLYLVRRRLGAKYPICKNKIRIESENNFPTSAGIASSASGFCALTTALCACLGIEDKKEISILSRLGSGSASRSVYGGFVMWKAGTDMNDSYAVEIKPKEHWNDIIDLIAITDEKQKKISSKDGMENTAKNSLLLTCRLKTLNKRKKLMINAINSKDFCSLATQTMKDSNQMHATMFDSWPPIFYMNDISKDIVYAIEELNKDKVIAGYTFDAGPNAHIILQKKNLNKIKKEIENIEGVKRTIISEIGNGAKILD